MEYKKKTNVAHLFGAVLFSNEFRGRDGERCDFRVAECVLAANYSLRGGAEKNKRLSRTEPRSV